MWKEEFKRLLFSKKTIIVMVIFMVIGILSFSISYKDKEQFINTYNRNLSDVNKENMEELINNYNGISFNLDFFLTSDFIDIFIIILFLFVGIFLSSDLFDLIENGYINFLISRTKYKKYIKNKLIASNLYITIILLITFLIITFLGLIYGGIGSGISGIGYYTINFYSLFFIIIIQFLIITLLITLINSICMLSCFVLKNRFVIQSLPFIVFLILPLILCSSVGNMIRPFGEVISVFSPFNIIFNIYNIFQSKFNVLEIILAFTPYIIYTIILIIIWKLHIKKMEKDCL